MKIKLRPRFFVIFGLFIVLIFVGVSFIISETQTMTLRTVEKGKIVPVPVTRSAAIQTLKDQYKNKFVIVFFYDGYTDQNQALNAIQVLKAATVLVEPFKSLEKDIVFKSFTTDSSKCRVKEESNKKILVCDTKLIDSFRSLGIDHLKLVILSPLEFDSTVLPARGANSWITLSTFQGKLSVEDHKRFLGLSFMQSLGRSLGLATEDDVASGSASLALASMPNCAQDEAKAKEWWGQYPAINSQVGYFKGCLGNASYVYPEKDTLMSARPKKESYGMVSTDYLRGVLSCFYGNKTSPAFPAGEEATYSATLKSCTLFKNQFPDFWKE